MDHFATRCRHQPKRLAPERSGFGRCLKPEMLEVMARWRVDLIGEKPSTLGTVEAADERAAIAEAAKNFYITPARRHSIRVAQIDREGGA
jgi:hypothetical protein